jgi:hypothetical protein
MQLVLLGKWCSFAGDLLISVYCFYKYWLLLRFSSINKLGLTITGIRAAEGGA